MSERSYHGATSRSRLSMVTLVQDMVLCEMPYGSVPVLYASHSLNHEATQSPTMAQKEPINHDSSCCDKTLIQHKLSYIKSIFFNRLFLISNIIHPRIGSSSVVRAFAWGCLCHMI